MGKKINLKKKAIILLVVWLMICVNNVLSNPGTVTNNDDQTTSTDSSIIIDWDDSWINVDNATIANQSYTATVSNQWNLGYEHRGDRWFNASTAADMTNAMMLGWNASNATLIQNSNGNSWSATVANFQSAIDDLPNGGTIWLPICNISITNDLDWDDNINVIGSGYNTILFLPASTNINMIDISGKSNILISNIRFECNNWSQSTYNLNAIEIDDGSSNITIIDCWFFNGSASFIEVDDGAEFVTVERCTLHHRQREGWSGAIWLRGENNRVINCDIKDTYATGVVMEGWSSADPTAVNLVQGNYFTGEIAVCIYNEGGGNRKATKCVIIGNTMVDFNCSAYIIPGSSYDWARGILGANDSIIMGNYINGSGGTGIECFGNSTVSGNIIIRELDTSGHNNSHGIRARPDHSGTATITNNIISGYFSGNGIKGGRVVFGNSIDNCKEGISDSRTITSNNIVNCNSGIYCAGGTKIIGLNFILDCSYSGIDSAGQDDIIATGNTIDNCGAAQGGIRLSSSDNWIITINRILNCQYSIREQGSSDYNLINDNNVRDNTEQITLAGDNSIIKDNIGNDYDHNEIWGELYIYNNSVATGITTQGYYHNVTEGVAAGEINGFTYATGNLTANISGLYHISVKGCISGTINTEYHIAVGLNAVRQTNLHGEHRVDHVNNKVHIGASGYLRLAAGDKVNLMVENVDSTADVTIHSGNLNLLRIGN